MKLDTIQLDAVSAGILAILWSLFLIPDPLAL